MTSAGSLRPRRPKSSGGSNGPAPFDPLIRQWFVEEIGDPTEAQATAWPHIAAGEHVLVSAPTGSGKTLTAFLWALDRLLTGAWSGDKTRVLYISPLRALNTDIRRNLQAPLAALRERFAAAGRPVPRIQVATRSGDTPQSERRKMLRHPPEILVTTPESLNVLLTSKSGRGLLGDLEAVILDEIHAVVGSKRGTHLMTAVDRLVLLSGEFQRIALSATVKPMETVAQMVAGYELLLDGPEPAYRARPMRILRSTAHKQYQVKVRFPIDVDPESEMDDDSMWEMLTRDFRKVIGRNQSTLLFANSRRMTEKATRLLNVGAAAEMAYSHHGSLSREVRSVVEKRLKDGVLKAIVATNSLELGIDVGSLDEVLLIQAPRSVSSAVQRIGRAGHGVGEVSRGVFYPTFGRDLLESAVVARAVVEQDIEELHPVEAPLDVLAQVILSMTVAEPWDLDELFHQLRTSWAYHHLPRRQFDSVLDMLAGRYADSRIRELRPRAHLDRARGTIKARSGVDRLLYMAGGTIADRGYFALRLHDSNAKIGDLDEEFVWERSIGDNFTLGTQSWQIRKITHNDVLVAPGRGPAGIAPFWRADAQDRGFELCQKIAAFLARAESRLKQPAFRQELEQDWHMEPKAAEALLEFLADQKAAVQGKLPREHSLLVERCRDRTGGKGGSELVILHTFWGGTVNRPLAMVMKAAWDAAHPDPIDIFSDDCCVMARLPEHVEASELFALVPPDHIEELLRSCLENTGYFGSRFRWAAGISLLLPKAGFRQRMPLWLSRQKSKKLLDSVLDYGDFPILVETWRTCLRDEFDLPHLKQKVQAVREAQIPLVEARSERPSPLAAGLVWQYTNQYMYEDDSPELGRQGSGVSSDVLQELIHSSHLRPRIPAGLVRDFRAKVQRLAPGYAPAPGDELVLWIEERQIIPSAEWADLLDAMARDHQLTEAEIVEAAAEDPRIVGAQLPGATPVIATPASLERLSRAFQDLGTESIQTFGSVARDFDRHPPSGRLTLTADDSKAVGGFDLSAAVAEWLRFQGPMPIHELKAVFGLGDDRWIGILEPLLDSRTVVIDELTGSPGLNEICDAENLEILLRWLRQERRPQFEPRAATELPLFLAEQQGLTATSDGLEGLQDRLEQLFGLPLPVGLWETEILPARLDPYYPSWLDSAMQQSDLSWLGCGKERVTFGFDSDLELFLEPEGCELEKFEPEISDPVESDPEAKPADLLKPLAVTGARFTSEELARKSASSAAEVEAALWSAAWQGRVINDTWIAVRQGIQNHFQPDPEASRSKTSRLRGGRARPRRGAGWRLSSPKAGSWLKIDPPRPPSDALELEEQVKDRVRLLLSRYGVLFRELVKRELPVFQWSRIFRTLRLMELSGEVLAGYFFHGPRGLQFMAHGAFRRLSKGLVEDVVFGLNAADPASLCGVELEGLKAGLPSRLVTTHLVYHGHDLVLVSKRRGKELEIRVTPDHPRLDGIWGILKRLITREVQPLSSILVEQINDLPAAESPFVTSLGRAFRTTREGPNLRLWKRYGPGPG